MTTDGTCTYTSPRADNSSDASGEDQNCLQRDLTGTCVRCQKDLELKNSVCVSKSCADANCELCSSYETCETCLQGFTLSFGQCVDSRCNLNGCLSCLDSWRCSTCSELYLLTPEGLCEPQAGQQEDGYSPGSLTRCPVGCRKCLTSVACLECLPLHLLSEGKCTYQEEEKVEAFFESENCENPVCFENNKPYKSICSSCHTECSLEVEKRSSSVIHVRSKGIFLNSSFSRSTFSYKMSVVDNQLVLTVLQSSFQLSLVAFPTRAISKSTCKVIDPLLIVFQSKAPLAYSETSSTVISNIISAGHWFSAVISIFFPLLLNFFQSNCLVLYFYVLLEKPSTIFGFINYHIMGFSTLKPPVNANSSEYYTIDYRIHNKLLWLFENPISTFTILVISVVKIAQYLIKFLLAYGFPSLSKKDRLSYHTDRIRKLWVKNTDALFYSAVPASLGNFIFYLFVVQKNGKINFSIFACCAFNLFHSVHVISRKLARELAKLWKFKGGNSPDSDKFTSHSQEFLTIFQTISVLVSVLNLLTFNKSRIINFFTIIFPSLVKTLYLIWLSVTLPLSLPKILLISETSLILFFAVQLFQEFSGYELSVAVDTFYIASNVTSAIGIAVSICPSSKKASPTKI